MSEMQQELPAAPTTEHVQPTPETQGQQPEVAGDGLEERLRQAELKAAEHHDAWLRAKAEAENARRRAQEEVDKARKYAVEKFAGELLAVKDSLEAALAAGAEATPESLKSGVELTLKQLSSVLEKNHVREVNPLGEKFDPHLHQAIAMVAGEGEANTVASVLQKGYLLHERVLRPALVTVFQGKAQEGDQAET
jgi:molecular chaperone GrpE